MVHLQTLREQNEYYDKNREKILNPDHKYAIIDGNTHTFYDRLKDLYKDHPHFKPNAQAVYGTLPLFIDIVAELRLPKYQKRALKEKLKNWDEDFLKLMERHERLLQERANLERRVK